MEKELPKNWVETNLENIFNLQYGKGLLTSELTDEGFDVYGANGIIGKYSKYSFENSKVIISCRGAASGVIHKTNCKSYITSNSIILNELANELINLDFVKYAMTSIDKSIFITGTAQPQITIQLLKYLQFPLAPLAEQNRIAQKLDKLFAQLETIKTSIENIPVLLKNFRQQVLRQAVTGKLTEKWRVGRGLEIWKEEKVKDIATKLGSGSTPKGGSESYLSEGIPLVRSMNVVFGGIKNQGLAFINKKQAETLKNVEIHFNDILLNITGASIGRVCLADNSIVGGRVNQHVFIIRAKKDLVFPEYINIYFSSSIIQNFINDENYGVTRQSITKTQIQNITINVPPLSEQQEIVSRVESLFSKTDAIEQQYKLLKEKIDTLPQTLLHKAFNGELTAQLESDGDAKELLKEIETLKNITVLKKTPTKKRLNKVAEPNN